MSELRMNVDGKDVPFSDGMTVLEACQQADIAIPTLCHHDALEPFGGCRLCIVEVDVRGWTQTVVSCVYPAADGLVVRTRSEQIDKLRKTLLELLLAHAPESPPLQELVAEYGAVKGRFGQEASFCVHCGLCVRYCHEVKQLDAVAFIERGVNKEISFLPDVAAAECDACKECFPLCPTSYLQAAYVLVGALSGGFPRAAP